MKTKQSAPQTSTQNKDPAQSEAILNLVSESPQDRPLLTAEDLKVLKAPFSKDRLGVKVQSLNKDRTRAMLVLYLQHTDVQDRLEEVDPAWTCEVISEERAGDTVYVRSRMTVKGVTRENVGEGGDPKSAYSDALKRCAMLFGIGRYLYDSVTVWTEYNDSRDRYHIWTVDEYDQALRRSTRSSTAGAVVAPPVVAPNAQSPNAQSESTSDAEPSSAGLTKRKVAPRSKGVVPNSNASSGSTPNAASGKARPREELNKILMGLYRPYLAQYPETQFSQLLQGRYGVGETRLMTVEQLEDLVKFMEQKLAAVA